MLFVLLIFVSINHTYAQVTADFVADDTLDCTPFTVHFTNLSTGENLEYLWTFGPYGQSTDENPDKTFTSPGDIPVTLEVTNTVTLESDEITKYIHVLLTPSATLIIDSTNACVNGIIQFRLTSSIDSAVWDFGDGTNALSFGNYMYHAYEAYGNYNVQCITYHYECSDTSSYYVWVDGPIAEFTIPPEEAEACKGDTIEFTMTPIFDVTSWYWEPETGVIINGENPATHTYEITGDIYPKLTVSGSTGTCTIEDTLHILEVIANFVIPDIRCHEQPVIFTNTSQEYDNSEWDLGNGTSSMLTNPVVTYSAGTYIVELIVENIHGCKDTIEKTVVINPLPEIELAEDTTVCPGVETELEAFGGHIIFWTPSSEFDDPTSYTPIIMPDSDTIYTAIITDTITGCTNSADITIYVQEGFVQGKITVFPHDTTVIVGDSVTAVLFDSLSRDLFYEWSPDERISCTDCPNPTMQPLHSTTYTLAVSDTNQCAQSETFEVTIEVREEYRIGIPEAFTPNDDMINDIIKVDGWGIQELIEFRIFNRWGVEVFYTTDISEGWDGYYNGKLQNVDTYSYIIKARMWDENITTIQGTFTLLR